MTQLSEVPFENLKVGDRVLSSTGTEGNISKIEFSHELPNDLDRKLIEIKWNHGQHSYQAHYALSQVQYLGQ